jgi:tetratricopeptide (TPR) repeat protein
VTDDIRALSAQLAGDPSSLAFLRLGEALRQRGQLDAALKVAVSGLGRYQHLPDAHDLYARILADKLDYAGAFDEWDTVLRLAPHHIGANKGIGYLYYRAGELESALYHLRFAAELDPQDSGLRAAVERVAGGREIWDQPFTESTTAPVPAVRQDASGGDPLAPMEGARERLLLVDQQGLRLGGGLTSDGGVDVSEEAAAALATCSYEASRAVDLLELGDWTHLTIEGRELGVCLVRPTPDTSLLAAMSAGLPAGQLTLFADRAAKAARVWLERHR